MNDTKAVAAHLEHLRLRGLAESTIRARHRHLVRLMATLPCPLLQATPAGLAAWRAALTVAPQQVGNYVSQVFQFYAWAVQAGLIRKNPARGIPRPRRGRRLPRPIGERELLAALACAPPRVRPWLVLAGWAGLRACEIAGLRRENVLDNAAVPVLIIAADATKGRNERVVPMSAFVLAELAPLLPARGFVFRRADGRPGPNLPHAISHLANEHLRACGISATLHQLRHRFGTMAYRADHDLRAVQELMGHADPATTAGYAAYDQAAAIAAVQAIPAPGPVHIVRAVS